MCASLVSSAAPLSSNSTPTLSIMRSDGRYWLAYRGQRMLWHGVNCVLPADGSHGAKYDVRAAYDNDMARWTTSAWQRLTAWGFNAIGAWSANEMYALAVPHTRCAWLGGWGAAALVDVFSDDYKQRFDETVAQQITPHANDPGLLGFFCNNEMAWYGEHGWPTDPSRALAFQYCALPSNAPGKIAFVQFLTMSASNDVAHFNHDWEPAIASFNELPARTELLPRTRRAQQLILDWTGVVAEHYFSMVRAALNQHAPRALLLGARFAETAPRAVIEACGRYSDVISVNYYRKNGTLDTAHLDNVYALTRKPLMITEFSWRAMQNASGNSNSHGADVTVATQAERARCAERYCNALAALPYVIGWDWFQYFDQPPGGRFDGENSNYGLVSIHDTPYRELTAALRRVHARAAELHAASRHPLPRAFDARTWPELREIRLPAAQRGTRVPERALWRTLPEGTRIETWGDTPTHLAVHAVSNTLHIAARLGGWGGGVNLPHPALRARTGAGINVRGARYAVVRALVPHGMIFHLTLNESGAGPVGQQVYAGADDADGEAYTSMPARGTGAWHSYVFDLRECELSRGYGNQRGNATLDTQSLRDVAVFLPGAQPECTLVIASVVFSPRAPE